MITADRVEKTFAGQMPILHQLAFEIARGEMVSLVGPSGCGKSTLLRLIAGLEEVTSGRLRISATANVGESEQAAAASTRQRLSDDSPEPQNELGLEPPAAQQAARVGFVFQDPTLLPWRTVTQNIALPFELAGRWDQRNADRVRQSLRMIGLAEHDAKKFPDMLSGGMRMRVSLARALVTDPEILLLDEPFAALDDMLRQQLNEDLLKIWSEKKFTAVFVTHNVAEAVFLGQRVLVMSANPGRIVEQVSVPFEYPRPWELRADPQFAALVGRVTSRLREVAP